MARRPTAILGPSDAALRLGVSLSTVWRRIRDGSLPSLRKGGRRMIPESALDSFRPSGPRALAPFTHEHPIFRLAGAFRGGGKRPGSSEKHALLDR
jgi:excisionase family DNA binding protein